jgi:hypothetical protein
MPPTTPATRERLPNRRPGESFGFVCGGMNYTASVSRFPCWLAEIFLHNHKVGSDTDCAERDTTVVASIALQYGASIDVIRKALLRDPRGQASGPLGIALIAGGA